MKNVLAAALLISLLSAYSSGKKDPEPDPAMAEVTARGRLLFEYDQAAWHATDALQAAHPRKESLGRYIAKKADGIWLVAFGHLDDTRTRFLISYEATQGKTLEDFTLKQFEPPVEDTSFYFHAAQGIDTALAEFHGQNRPYNAAVLPTSSGQLYVYVVPAQTHPDVYPLGGDVRYLISSDGNAIIEKRPLHKGIIENKAQVPKGVKIESGVHSHVLTDVPEDTDVFYVLSRRPSMPEIIATSPKTMYEIRVDGSIIRRKM